MDTAHHQKFPFILDRNLAKAKCTGNRVCTSCDTVVLVWNHYHMYPPRWVHEANNELDPRVSLLEDDLDDLDSESEEDEAMPASPLLATSPKVRLVGQV